MLHGCVPVKLTFRIAEPPVQMAVVPIMVAVGCGLTVTVADPLPVLLQVFASVTLVMVYVFVEEGLTEIVFGELLILFNVTGVVPSVYVMLHG